LLFVCVCADKLKKIAIFGIIINKGTTQRAFINFELMISQAFISVLQKTDPAKVMPAGKKNHRNVRRHHYLKANDAGIGLQLLGHALGNGAFLFVGFIQLFYQFFCIIIGIILRSAYWPIYFSLSLYLFLL